MPENPYQTVNSFLFELSEDIPEVGKKYEYNTIDEIIDDEGNLTEHKINMQFIVSKMEGHRIDVVELKIVYLDNEEKENKPDDDKKEQKE